MRRVHRFEQIEIGGEFDFAVRITRCKVEIDDVFVDGQGGIEGEVRFAD